MTTILLLALGIWTGLLLVSPESFLWGVAGTIITCVIGRR